MKHMKHLFIALAAGFAATFAAAQIPMPAWELSEAVERQSGVMNYTNEKFDFRRLPMHRSISEFLHPGDTVQYRTFLFDVTVCDAGGPVSQLRFQSDPQVVRKEADTVTFVAADNAWLQVVALAHLPLDASDELVRHAVDSLKDIRTITDGMDILPAKQCGMSYALQYLFGRAGIDAEPLLSWQTYLSSDKAADQLRIEHPEAQIIAGGTDVLVQVREGRRAGKELISIQKLDELRGVTMEDDGTIRIGSLTVFSHIAHDPIIQKYINVLGEAVDMVGGPQIRNAGTIGGNTCNGVTSADSASTLHAWEAIVELTGIHGKRYLPIKDFYIKAGTVDINVAEGEIQTAILIPKESYENTCGYYLKYGMRNAMEIATTGCSVNVRLSADKKTFDRVRIGYGVAGPVPMRAPSAEAFLTGKPVTMENIEACAKTVLEDINPRDSWRASKAFRRHIAVEMCRRGLIESVKRCGGEI